MATPTTNTVIDPASDITLNRKTLELATSNGGVYIFDTTKDIYVTQVTEYVTNQAVYPQYNTITNLPGSTPNGIQFNANGSFSSDPLLTYINQVLNANTIATYAIKTDNILYANGANWNFGEANYGNSNVANFLPTYNGNLNPNNATFTGNVSVVDVSNLLIPGGNSGEALISNGSNGLAFVPVPYGGNLSNGNSNVFVYGNTNVAISVNAVSNVAVFSTTGANIAGNLGVTGNLSATAVNAQVVVGNSSIVLTSANIKLAANNNVVANIVSSGDGVLTTTGVNVAGYVTATGNITAPNLIGALSNGNSNISITGNSNIAFTSGSNTILTVTPTGVNATANITGTNFIGKLANGNSNIVILSNGNISVTASGTTSVVTISSGGLTVSGNANISGDITIAGNISVAGGLSGNLSNGNSNIGIAANANVVISSGGNANVLVVSPTGVAVTGTQTVSANSIIGGGLYVGNTSVNSGLVLTGANGGNASNVRTITIYPGTSIASSYSMILPTGLPGSNGLVLGSNTDGTLYWTTGATPNTLVNGNSNVIVSGNSNVSVSVAGNANVFTVTGTGANIAGTANVTGNIFGANVTVTGNASANNLSATANLSVGNVAIVTGNLTAGNISTAGLIGATGNITGGNLISNGTISTSSNISGGNITSGANISAGSNIVGNNVTANTLITSTNANITGTLIAANANITKLNANGNVSFTGANVSLGAVGNLHITGGSNNQVLTTDGTGNLIWAGNGVTTGTGIQNGNSNVIIASGNGNITMSANGISNILTVTGSNSVVIAGNLNATGANVSLGSNANLKITGGSNGQALITDGAGNLTWGTVAGGIITSLTSGSSNLVVGASGNVTTSVGGIANVIIATSTGVNIAGYANITGAITGSNLTINAGANANTANIQLTARYLTIGSGAGGQLTIRDTTSSQTTIINADGNITPSDGQGNLIANWTVGNTLTTTSLVLGNGTVTFANATTVTLGANSNVKLSGGSNGQFLKTDGAGNLSWDNPSNVTYASISNGSSSVTVAANSNVSVSVAGTTVTTFASSGANISGYANVTGAITAGGTIVGNNLMATYEISSGTDANIGGNLYVNTNTDSTANITNIINGNLFDGNNATFSSNISITDTVTAGNASIGNLSSNGVVSFTGSNVSLGNVANIQIQGTQSNGQFLQTYGNGKVVWADILISNSAPANSSSTGKAGQLAYASGFLYVCVAANTWQRTALTTF